MILSGTSPVEFSQKYRLFKTFRSHPHLSLYTNLPLSLPLHSLSRYNNTHPLLDYRKFNLSSYTFDYHEEIKYHFTNQKIRHKKVH